MTPRVLARADALLAQALCGRCAAWTDACPESVLTRARENRVEVLLHERLGREPWGASWPAPLRDALAEAARWEAVRELLLSREVARVLESLHAAGVSALLLKGTGLAYTLYPSPAERPRTDTDLLVPPAGKARAEEVLAASGYVRAPRIASSLVEHQVPYFRDDVSGFRSVIDLHWRVSNRQVLADAFPFAALEAEAVAAPRLSPYARTLDPIDALQVACVHAPAHHPGEAWPLLWLYDIHLLAGCLGRAQRLRFAERAEARRIAGLCHLALTAAARCFEAGSRGPVAELLASQPSRSEPSLRLASGSPGDPLLDDLRALPGAGARLRYLAQVLAPGVDYMRAHHGEASRHRLPTLYVRRALRGIWRRALKPKLEGRLRTSRDTSPPPPSP